MKYDSQLSEVKSLLPSAKNILIALPKGADIDKLAAGLALFLAFEGNKEASIALEDDVKVGQAHLFGVDHIKKELSSAGGGGNLTLSLEGVASSDGIVPALEKLDWFAENNNLNLVFHVISGQTFQPTKIVPRYQGSGFNLIFVIGATNLNSLGSIYTQNTQLFTGVHIVNIDNKSTNTGFGQTNVLDPNSSSLSEMISFIISELGLNLDGDTATNLIAGIYQATSNLANANADTFFAVSNLLKAGGQKPKEETAQKTVDFSGLIPQTPPSIQTQSDAYTTPPIVQPAEQISAQVDQPSPEERPLEEGTISETVEPEWLTPKIFSSKSLG